MLFHNENEESYLRSINRKGMVATIPFLKLDYEVIY